MSPPPAALSPAQAEQASRLLARAERTFGAAGVAAAIPHRKAIVFLSVADAKARGAPVDEVAAQRAVDALRRIQDIVARGGIPGVEDLPAPADVEALETCIRFMRPALLVKDGRVPAAPPLDWTAEQKAAVEAVLPGIGSIGFRTSPGPLGGSTRTGIATCFAVGPRAVVTNVHVVDDLPSFGRRLADAVIRFDVEWDAAERHAPVAVKGELGRCRERDVAILETETDVPFVLGLPVSRRPVLAGAQAIVVVGHPCKDARNPAWAQVMFEGKLGVKRVSPGVITGLDEDAVYHDASTLGGNSGSPVLDLASGQVVAVHSLGEFSLRNEAVGSGAIAAEQGLRSSVARWV